MLTFRENSFHQPASNNVIQTQLEIGKEEDEQEKEANAVADKVMRMSSGSDDDTEKMSAGKKIQPMKNPTENAVGTMQERPLTLWKMAAQQSEMMAVPLHVESRISNSKGSGSSLPEDTQEEMSSKIGADFSNVKVHTDNNSHEMNKEIGAKAFTHGSDIYFNKGQYNPSSQAGKHLLAHELTHTVQQGAIVRRTEVDTSVMPKDLKDSETKIDEHVKQIITTSRSKYLKDKNDVKHRKKFVDDVYAHLGKLTKLLKYQSYIEVWAGELGPEYVSLPERSETKYANVDRNFWKTFQVLGHSMLVAGVPIGSDKLGHFFQQGYEYFDLVYRALENKMATERKTAKKEKRESKEVDFSLDNRKNWSPAIDLTETKGYQWEKGVQGADTTGVFSYADLAANAKGYDFYLDLFYDPHLTFSIRNYMREKGAADGEMQGLGSESARTSWSEERNTNAYALDVAKKVWENKISGTWEVYTRDENKDQMTLTMKDDSVESTVTGSYSYNDKNSGKTISGTINGAIDYKKAALGSTDEGKKNATENNDIVEKIVINSEWKEDGNVKGTLVIASYYENGFKLYFKAAEGDVVEVWTLSNKKA